MITSYHSEPFAIGFGYPFSILKIFQDNQCLSGKYPNCVDDSISESESKRYVRLFDNGIKPNVIKKGDIFFIPNANIAQIQIGFIIYIYLFWLFTPIRTRKN